MIILKSFSKANLQQVCLQIEMPERLWACWGTYRECVHRAKIFQVMKEIAKECKQAIATIVRLDDFQQALFDCID